jgi:hypothetical protein
VAHVARDHRADRDLPIGRLSRMCTVTLIARESGYALGMNRDESLTRVAALPPARRRLGRREAVFPCEPGGGTWIGVNDGGVTLALINWYTVPARITGKTMSRGEVAKAALPSDSPTLVEDALAQIPLEHVNPFRLIGVFPASHTITEWRWNLGGLARLEHPWRTTTWISSGFDEPGAQQSRNRNFADALCQRSAGSVEWLRRLHRSHIPEPGPYSICMHRRDAATVSYTEIVVSRQLATIGCTPGAPCCTAPMPTLRLQLQS